jgi:toxin-antitoxin system PIN domain toxin
VIVPDVNLLLYSYVAASPEHAKAREWWSTTLNGTETVGLCIPVLFGFLRLITNRRAVVQPIRIEDAIASVESWLARPQVELIHPGPRHLEIAFGLLRQVGAGGNLTTDAQIAAHAIENQAELHSNDGGFVRFTGLRWVNPLAKR